VGAGVGRGVAAALKATCGVVGQSVCRVYLSGETSLVKLPKTQPSSRIITFLTVASSWCRLSRLRPSLLVLQPHRLVNPASSTRFG